MAYEVIVPRKFSQSSLDVIEKADEVCKEYMTQGYTLTLRQLYYQFVARGWLPNKQTEYKRLGSIINDARLAGLIDWDAMEDRTRNLEKLATWDSPSDILNAVSEQFRYDRWATQPFRCEVWVEKEALVGVVEPMCNQYRVPYFACRGYTSQSEQYRASKRFADYADDGKSVTIFHLGDHDPSGIDMTRDNRDRLQLFLGAFESHDSDLSVVRLALNMDQVHQYNPPPNPAKMTDSRFAGYEDQYGNESWELDALNPTVIGNLLRANIEGLIDQDAWGQAIEEEKKARARLKDLATNWKD